jgi:hypothetical protein
VTKRRSATAVTRALAKRLGADALARRVGVTPATVQRWVRNGPPPSRQADVRAAYERSERARQAAAARAEALRERERAAARERQRRSEAAKEGWRRRRVREGRAEILRESGKVDRKGEPITGRKGGDHFTLRRMIEKSEAAWRRFKELAEAEGRSLKEIKKEWFSPKAKKKR